MNVRIDYIKEGNDEIVIHCKEINEEILSILSLISMKNKKISAYVENELHYLNPTDVYYFETVDHSIFAYTKQQVFKVSQSLNELETTYQEFGFFRCSKSMIINLNEISFLRSELGNRIIATLKNDEQIIISRHYAKLLRERLRQSVI